MSDLPPAVAALLASYSPVVQALALKTRALVLATLPAVQEQPDPPDKLISYGYGPKMTDVVCVLMPLKAGVNLSLPNGIDLPDPAGLLAGTGKRHPNSPRAGRHVRLTTPAAVDQAALLALFQASVARHGRAVGAD
jgi:hypothetical protein